MSLWTRGRQFWQRCQETFAEKPKNSISNSGNKVKNLVFQESSSAKSFSGLVNVNLENLAAENFSPRNREWLKEKNIKKITQVQNVPLYRLMVVLRTLPEVFHRKAETFWLKFRERYSNFLFSKPLLFLERSSGHVNCLFWEPCNFFSKLGKSFGLNARKFLCCFISNELSFLKISSGQLICIFESPADKFQPRSRDSVTK